MSIASDTSYQSGEDMGENETESVMGKNDRKGNVLVIGNSGVGKYVNQCRCWRTGGSYRAWNSRADEQTGNIRRR